MAVGDASGQTCETAGSRTHDSRAVERLDDCVESGESAIKFSARQECQNALEMESSLDTIDSTTHAGSHSVEEGLNYRNKNILAPMVRVVSRGSAAT